MGPKTVLHNPIHLTFINTRPDGSTYPSKVAVVAKRKFLDGMNFLVRFSAENAQWMDIASIAKFSGTTLTGDEF